MSRSAIRKALETALKNFDPVFPTEYENVTFAAPDNGAAFQSARIAWATTENPTIPAGHKRYRGFFQVMLDYPAGDGSGDATTRAEAIEAAFYQGLSLTANGVTTHVANTPDIGSGSTVGNRYIVVVRIRFYADVFQ